jgi:co-chaperonin GroES (HSP10)
MARFEGQLKDEKGQERIRMGRALVALGMSVLDPGVKMAGAEPGIKVFLNKYKALVDKKTDRLEGHLTAYLSNFKKLEQIMQKAENNTDEGKEIVTPETSKAADSRVIEVAASTKEALEVPEVNEGDAESVDLYEGRETKRNLDDRMPSNDHSEMRKIRLAKKLDPKFGGAHMGGVTLTQREQDFLGSL